ncbi:hypothetical protein [Pseudomonas fragi]
MSGIKNFTVIAQSIKNKSDGLIAYVKYLTDEKVQSHKNTKIYPVFESIANSPDAFLKSTRTQVAVIERTSSGRSFSNYGQSFDFVLPKTIQPTPEQWQKITQDLLKVMHKEVFRQDPEPVPDPVTGKVKKNINYKGKVPDALTFAKRTFCNIHQQEKSHLNMLIPTVYAGERLQRVDRLRVLNEMKKQFNLSVLLHCNMDYKAYKPENVKLGRRKPRNQYLLEKAAKAVEEANQKLLSEEKKATSKIEDLIHDAHIYLEYAGSQQKQVLDTIVTQGVESLTDRQKSLVPSHIEAEKQALSMKKLFEDLQTLTIKAVTWITSIIVRADEFDIESNRQEVLSSKTDIELNPLYSDDIGDNVEKILDAYEQQVEDKSEFNPVSKKRIKIKIK